jgi:hypothetical protein
MGRPVKYRDADSYQRDIEHFRRLRAAIVIDRRIGPEVVRSVTGHIDALLRELQSLKAATRSAA